MLQDFPHLHDSHDGSLSRKRQRPIQWLQRTLWTAKGVTTKLHSQSKHHRWIEIIVVYEKRLGGVCGTDDQLRY